MKPTNSVINLFASYRTAGNCTDLSKLFFHWLYILLIKICS